MLGGHCVLAANTLATCHTYLHSCRMGRPGTAYSLLCRDELPYLLDLHLFLGKRVEAAPLVVRFLFNALLPQCIASSILGK